MKFEFKKIGLIDDAVIDLADLTILCGENNTGKTYVTYTLYGFLRSWRQILFVELEEKIDEILRESTNSEIDLDSLFTGQINKYLERIAKRYAKGLPRVFASSPDLLSEAVVRVTVSNEINLQSFTYHRSIKDSTGGKTLATLRKAKDSSILEILIADQSLKHRKFGLIDFVSDAIADIVFAPYLPDVFIASAERTGAAIFRKELDFARTRLIEALGQQDRKDLRNPFHLFERMQAGYAMPVQDNVDFVRQIEDIDKQVSPLVEAHPKILEKFEAVIGGSYKVVKGKGLYYQPRGVGKPRLSMSESSSSVRALLDIGFYLRCRAESGNLLMIDEPELNLHPVNQRAFARLIAYLVNCGVRVFMTTHSDYIIKELNTLIMLNAQTQHTKAIQLKYKYGSEEKIDPAKVKLFMTCSVNEKRDGGKGRPIKLNSLREAKIHPDQGIEVETFDTIIGIMNAIQTEILFGGEL
ncbi:AAA family ATPase [Nitrosomonas sp.]|uniref:AAA family ATPase n=1 Tax=Nitrosomonas sp. TaxID=42353 RepID=UPI00271F9C98|nr:AAA family ATPase [Nitrosomonas sp.]MDO8895760.1 AAA family ATPase [Nitrosomonas sp.]